MKYRIKIITFKTGRKLFFAQLKKGLVWTGIAFNAETSWVYEKCDSRDEALRRIDLHFRGNTKIQIIEFEYINKQPY
jgi:hypothetical protein